MEYSFGDLPENSTKTEEVSLQPMPFISSPPSNHDITLVTKSGLLWDSEQQEAIDKGNLIHNLLMNIYTEKDIASALKKSIKAGEMNAEDTEEYKMKVEEIIQHPDLQAYFTNEYQIYNEKELITENGFKRIDRLCLKNNEAVIIDYKTGDEKAIYTNQLNEYANYITEIGYQVKQKIIVYLYPSVTVKIL